MKKSKILTLTIFVCKAIAFLQLIALLFCTILLVKIQNDPQKYSDYIIEKDVPSQTILGLPNFKYAKSKIENADSTVAVSDLNPISLYFIYLQIFIISIFAFLALKEFIKIIRKVQTTETFQIANVKSFKQISKFLLIILLISSIAIISTQKFTYIGFNINYIPFVLMVLAYVMGEIFNEGNDLAEENRLTI